jgi:hypothetical protein
MQDDIDFMVSVAFFTAVASCFTLYFTPTKNKLRQAFFIGFAVILALLSGWYFAESNGFTSLASGIGGEWGVLAAMCWFVAASAALYVADLYVNIDELRNDRAYNIFGDVGLAGVTVGTAQLAFFFAIVPWFLADPSIFELKNTIRYISGVESLDAAGVTDVFLFSLDQTGKAILFDVAEVYRFGLTNLSNNPEHLTFSTLCLVYRTLVAVYVAVIAYRLIFVRADPK